MYGVQKTLPHPTTPNRMVTLRSKWSGGGAGCSRRAPRGLVVGLRPGRMVDVVTGRDRQRGREGGGGGERRDRREPYVRAGGAGQAQRRRAGGRAQPQRLVAERVALGV